MSEAALQQGQTISTATRTLLAAGYEVIGCQRHPSHAEIYCERISRLGALIRYTFAITDMEKFTPEQIDTINRTSGDERRSVVFVGRCSDEHQMSWEGFLEALGGAVPSWHALSPEYGEHLRTTAQNKLPEDLTGEAWQLFEDLAADGLEFSFGRRVRRLGGRKRGRLVSDMIGQLPDSGLVVVDAKAAKNGFDASWNSLRALVEYVKRQKQRQTGHNEVFGALVISSVFAQDADALLQLSRRFLAETSVALAFLDANTLTRIVELLRAEADIRNAMQWRPLLAGGLVKAKSVEEEIRKAMEERVHKGRD